MEDGNLNVWGVYSQRYYDGFKGKPVEFDGTISVRDNYFQGSFVEANSRSLVFGKFTDEDKLMVFKKEYLWFSRGEPRPTDPNFGFIYPMANCGAYFAGEFSDGDFEDDAHGLAFLKLNLCNKPENYIIEPEIIEKRITKFSFNQKEFISIPKRLDKIVLWNKILESHNKGKFSDANSLVKKLIDELPTNF